MFKHNFHTHTSYSDGSESPEAYVIAAMAEGMKSLGFSEHAPLPFENYFSVKDAEHLRKYVDEIKRLKEKYKGQLNIYAALEADYIPGVSLDFKHFKKEFQLDYIIGSVHLVKNTKDRLWFIDGPDREIWKNGLETMFDNDIRLGVKAYYEQIIDMVFSQKPEVVGHLDKIMMHNHNEYFTANESWYKDLVMHCLETLKQHDSIVEINTRGLYKKRYDTFFPSPDIMKEMFKLDIRTSISSDAHKPGDIALLLDSAAEALRSAGYREVWIFEENGWKAAPLN